MKDFKDQLMNFQKKISPQQGNSNNNNKKKKQKNKSKQKQNTSQPNKQHEKQITIPTNAGLYYYQQKDSTDGPDGYGKYLPDWSIYDLLGTSIKESKINAIAYEDYFKIKGPIQRFKLKTHYPGLIIGIGYTHAIAKSNDLDFQQGFFFDWTTGIPVIPGSSIKGVLRSVFPNQSDNNDIKNNKCAYISNYLDCTVNQNNIKSIESNIFEDKGDIFYDAYIKLPGKDQKIFAEDYITPHDHPLKNPKPLRHLKIAPDVKFCFQFLLKPNTKLNIGIDQKLQLFKQIIMDFGLGAKTNTGYGILLPDTNPPKK